MEKKRKKKKKAINININIESRTNEIKKNSRLFIYTVNKWLIITIIINLLLDIIIVVVVVWGMMEGVVAFYFHKLRVDGRITNNKSVDK
jgi:hypothetical protein